MFQGKKKIPKKQNNNKKPKKPYLIVPLGFVASSCVMGHQLHIATFQTEVCEAVIDE